MLRQFVTIAAVTLLVLSLGSASTRAESLPFMRCNHSLSQRTIVLNENNRIALLQTRPYEAILFQAEPLSPQVEWYLDGVLVQSGEADSFCLQIFRAGQRRLEVLYPLLEQKISLPITTLPYTNVSLTRLLPNPAGSDTQAEKIVLYNANSFPVVLREWKLRSRTSRTTIPIEGTIAPQQEMVLTVSSKLRNTGGTYDLYNESGELVDTLTYRQTHDGIYLVRDGITWRSESLPEQESVTETSESISVTGTVTKPEGKTFTITTNDGQIIRIVVHSSFNGNKPRLYKGDIVTVSGIWKRSKSGPYLSVRAGHEITLLRTSHTTPKATPKSKVSYEESTLQLTETVAAKEPPAPQTSPQVYADPVSNEAVQTNSPFTPYLRWLFTVMLTLGVILTLPRRGIPL